MTARDKGPAASDRSAKLNRPDGLQQPLIQDGALLMAAQTGIQRRDRRDRKGGAQSVLQAGLPRHKALARQVQNGAVAKDFRQDKTQLCHHTQARAPTSGSMASQKPPSGATR